MTVSLNDVLLAAENLVSQIQAYQVQPVIVPIDPFVSEEVAVQEAASLEVDTLEGREAGAVATASGASDAAVAAAVAAASSAALAGASAADAAAAGAAAAVAADNPVVTTPVVATSAPLAQ